MDIAVILILSLSKSSTMKDIKDFFSKINDTDIRHIVALVVIFGVLGIVVLQHFVKVPADNLQTVQRNTDQLIVLGFAAIIYYFFGGNKKERDQN